MKRLQPLTIPSNDVCGFIDAYIARNELNKPWALFPHQRAILSAMFDFDEDGRLPYDTFLYSCPKKSGKTTINAAVLVWWAFTQEPPNELLVLSNDYEQASSRVFKSVVKLIQNNPILAASADVQTARVTLSNGTTILPLASEYAGAAGSNHGLTSWDELWGYVSESSRRLWDELTPVPTRQNSLRFISTYAGYENESLLLRELYLQGVSPDEHADGKGEQIHPTLPVYANAEARLCVYWDHEHRLPWQTPSYLKAQETSLRPNAYKRLHLNQWTTAESVFLTSETYDSCVDQTHRPLMPSSQFSLHGGFDASTHKDFASGVFVYRDDENRLVLARHRVWKPRADAPLDIEATIEAFIQEIYDQYPVVEILCDPYQLHRSIMTLQARGVPIRGFPQTVNNTSLMGQTLFELLKYKNLRLYPDDELRQQALNAVAVESRTGGFRLAKEKASKKIDAVVALSMACVSAVGQMNRQPMVFSVAGDYVGSVTEMQERLEQETAEKVQKSAADIAEAVKTTGLWWPH